MYILDELIIGFYMVDIENFISIIEEIVDNGNMVIIIEYNIDVIKRVDWIIELGFEGGIKGGRVIFEGILK